MKVKFVCRKFECRKDNIHYKTQLRKMQLQIIILTVLILIVFYCKVFKMYSLRNLYSFIVFPITQNEIVIFRINYSPQVMCDAHANIKLHAPVSFHFHFDKYVFPQFPGSYFSINRSRGIVSLFKTPIVHKSTFVKTRLINYKLVHSVLCRE